MKVWKDANEAIKMIHEVPEELQKTEREMQKKPRFDKYDNKRKISKKKQNK